MLGPCTKLRCSTVAPIIDVLPRGLRAKSVRNPLLCLLSATLSKRVRDGLNPDPIQLSTASSLMKSAIRFSRSFSEHSGRSSFTLAEALLVSVHDSVAPKFPVGAPLVEAFPGLLH
jgi:hypothetical protein